MTFTKTLTSLFADIRYLDQAFGQTGRTTRRLIRVGSNEYLQSMFLGRNTKKKKTMYTPVNLLYKSGA